MDVDLDPAPTTLFPGDDEHAEINVSSAQVCELLSDAPIARNDVTKHSAMLDALYAMGKEGGSMGLGSWV